MNIGVHLRRLRSEKKLSQHEVADHVGVSQSTYQGWESDRSSPKVAQYVQLATFFGIDLKELIPENLTVIIPAIDKVAEESPVLNAQQLYKDLTTSQKQIIRFQEQRIEHLETENQQLREQLGQRNAQGVVIK